MNVKNGIVEYFQWNYRIFCYFFNKDVFLKVFELIDDLVIRFFKKYDIRQIVKIKVVRFNLVIYECYGYYDFDFGCGWINDVVYSLFFFDDYMM